MTLDKKIATAGVILAGGRGSRMQSELPKALHTVAGKPMVVRVIEMLQRSGVESIILVIGRHHIQYFSEILSCYPDIVVCVQSHPLGTAHAVASVGHILQGVSTPSYACHVPQDVSNTDAGNLFCSHLVIVPADVPGISSIFVRKWMQQYMQTSAHVSLVAMRMHNPYGYGRIIQNPQGRVQQIVEQREASVEQQQVSLCYSGLMIAQTQSLFSWLALLQKNEKGEYYLTDIVSQAYKQEHKIALYIAENPQSFMGVNTPEQREQLQNYLVDVVDHCHHKSSAS